MALYNLGIVCVTLCVCLQTSVGQNQTVGDGIHFEETSLERGVKPIFSLYHRFLTTVYGEDFYEKSNETLNIHYIYEVVESGEYERLQSDWRKITESFGGLAACVIMGLIFLVAMPIVGFFFCCCYCCCNRCGATKEIHDPKHAKCKRVTYVTLLLIFSTMMLVGAVISLLGAELLHRSLKNEYNQGMIGRMNSSLTNFEQFTIKTISDVKTQVKSSVFDRGIPRMVDEVTRTVDQTVINLMLAVNATPVLNSSIVIGSEAQKALSDIRAINSSVTALLELQNNISSELENINATCGTPCAGLTFAPNFSAVPTLEMEASQLRTAQQIVNYTEEAKREFDRLKNEVNTSVNQNVDRAISEIENIKKTVNDSLNELDKVNNKFNLSSAQETLTDVDNSVKEYEKYSWYVFIAVGCSVLLPVLFYYLGVLFGLCGERPRATAACCNKGTGSNFLVAGICCSFLFASIVMIVTTLLFMLGGTTYLLTCKYLNDGVQNVEKFEPTLFKLLGSNPVESQLNTSIGDVLQHCKENEGIYKALNLAAVFDIDTLLNISSIEEPINTLKNVNISLPDITILTSELEGQLRNYSNSGLDGVNYTSFFAELEKPYFPNNLNVTENIIQLRNSNRTSEADRLEWIQTTQLVQVDQEKNELKRAVEDLQRHSNVTDEVNSLIANINNSQNSYNSQKDHLIKEGINATVDAVTMTIDDVATELKNKIKNNVGMCKPVYDDLQAISDAVCVTTLDPLNCIWFGLGWSLFFYIPCFIFAALLSSLYKRQEPHKKKQDFEDRHGGGYDGYGGDNIPLTSPVREQINGKHNAAFRDGADQGGYLGSDWRH